MTMMLEVKVGLEELPGHVRRWVKPADEVRKHMEDIMARCERAPEGFLALRLPIKGSAAAVDSENVSVDGISKEGTPVSVLEEKTKKSSIKYVKKTPSSSALKNSTSSTPTVKKAKGTDASMAVDGATDKPAAPQGKAEGTMTTTDDSATTKKANETEGEAATETGRPRRAVRKSVRISEG